MKLKDIKKIVEKHGKVKDIATRKRTDEMSYLRWIYFKLAADFGKYHYTKIGKEVDRDRVTVMHGIKEFDYVLSDKIYSKVYNDCKMELMEEMYKRECNVLHDHIETYRVHFEKVKDQYYKLKSIAETC